MGGTRGGALIIKGKQSDFAIRNDGALVIGSRLCSSN